MAALHGPRRAPHQGVVEEVELRLGNEGPPGFCLERRDAPLPDGGGSGTVPLEELVDVELRHISSNSDRNPP